MDLTHLQHLWLIQHGDRGPEDVVIDCEGYFVMMANAHGDYKKVYLPKKSELLKLKTSK